MVALGNIFPQALRIGVMFESCQLSDVVGVDCFGAISQDYMHWLGDYAPPLKLLEPFLIPMEFIWISSSHQPALTTADARIVPVVTYDEAPRDLDIVIIGGPLPTFRPAAADRFMKEAWNTTRTWMTTCVGAMWLASTGLLDGHKATTNRLALPLAVLQSPRVHWQDQRWVIDEKPYTGKNGGKGELWTSGAAMAGVDMMATYVSQKFDQKLVSSLVFEGLDIDVKARGQYYSGPPLLHF